MNQARRDAQLKDLERQAKNPDNQLPGTLGATGRVSRVTKTDIPELPQLLELREFPEFQPSKHELTTLVKYWAEEAMDIQGSYQLSREQFETFKRLHTIACSRLRRISGLLNEEAFDAAVA